MKLGPDPAPSRGRRAIVIGAITEKGMLPQSFKVWLDRGRVEDGDYHRSMDSDLFEQWLKEICPVLVKEANGRKPVLVIDNASYHSHCEEKVLFILTKTNFSIYSCQQSIRRKMKLLLILRRMEWLVLVKPQNRS